MDQALESYRPQQFGLQCCKHQHCTVFDCLRQEKRLYILFARGSPEDIKEIDDLIMKESEENRNLILNKPNDCGHTPLYIASQNGNLDMVKYLLLHKATLTIKSKVSKTEEESNLSVAARWSHENLVTFYLEIYKWPVKDLSQAKNAARTNAIKKLIAAKLIKHNKCCMSCIFIRK